MEDGNGASVHGYSTMVSRCVRGVEKIYEDGMAFCLLSRRYCLRMANPSRASKERTVGVLEMHVKGTKVLRGCFG